MKILSLFSVWFPNKIENFEVILISHFIHLWSDKSRNGKTVEIFPQSPHFSFPINWNPMENIKITFIIALSWLSWNRFVFCLFIYLLLTLEALTKAHWWVNGSVIAVGWAVVGRVIGNLVQRWDLFIHSWFLTRAIGESYLVVLSKITRGGRKNRKMCNMWTI